MAEPSRKRLRVLFLGPFDSPVRRFLLEGKKYDIAGTEHPLDAKWVAEQRFDFLVSFGYRHMVRPEVIALFPDERRRINLHISLLPYNRGTDPNLWSVLDGTPSGVTIHVLDEGLDTGKIVAQRQLDFDDEAETLSSSYDKLQEAMLELFKETWPALVAEDSEVELREQDDTKATLHRSAHKARLFEYFAPEGWNTKRAVVKKRYVEWCEAAGAGDVFKD